MKNAAFNPKNVFSLTLLLAGALFLTNCSEKEEITVKDQIVGEWEVVSFTINGTEQMTTSGLSSFEMEYDPYGGADGDFKWVWTGGGSLVPYSGNYEVDVEDSKVTLDIEAPQDYTPFIFDVDIEGDDLTMDGYWYSDTGEREKAIIQAERK